MRKVLVLIFLMSAFPVIAQNLPVPTLHFPAPAAGSTAPAAGSTAAAVQAPAGNLPSLKLSARIDPIKIYQGEIFYYMIELGWEKSGASCEMEFKLPEVPKAEAVKAIGSEFESDTALKAETENVKRVYKFQYYPEKSGKTTIAQADFEYRCRGTEPYAKVSAPPFPVEIYPKRFHLADLRGNRKFYGFLAAVLFAAILSVAIMIVRDWQRKAALKPAVEMTQSAEEKALELLKAADQYRIAGRYPDYFLGLERVLKTFLEEKYSIRWAGRERMKEEIARATVADLAEAADQFLVISDRVKFAGQEPTTQELDACYQAVRRIIDFKKLEISGGGK